jgi:hypothetical protein
MTTKDETAKATAALELKGLIKEAIVELETERAATRTNQPAPPADPATPPVNGGKPADPATPPATPPVEARKWFGIAAVDGFINEWFVDK